VPLAFLRLLIIVIIIILFFIALGSIDPEGENPMLKTARIIIIIENSPYKQ
jgi:hypothetical protein